MDFDLLFEKRGLVAVKLKEYLREFGHTKVSFSKKVDISRPTLDKLLNGGIDNKVSFDKHLKKILDMCNLTPHELISFDVRPPKVDVVYSQNAPSDYQLTDKAKKQYDLLMDIVDLCTLYYSGERV